MKKTILLAALALAAGTALATAQTDYSGVYSGELTVSLGVPGTPENKNIEIYPGSAENTVTFVLPDFTFMNMPLGDIVLPDIPVTDGSMALTDYPLLMAGLGNMTVTVDMTGTFADKLDASLTIDVPGMGGVPVTFQGVRTTEGYQVRNGGFEIWDTNGEPQYWNSFNTATGNLAGMVATEEQLKESKVVRPGSTGSKSAMVASRYAFIAKANGNLTTGRINAGDTDATNSANHNFSDPTAADNDDFLCPFIGAPDSLVVWAKYRPADGNIKNEANQARVSAIIHNGQRYQDPEGSNKYDSVKVATAQKNYMAIENYGWQRLAIPFDYSETLAADSAKYILVSFSTNATPGGGTTEGSFLGTTKRDSVWVDDLEMIYNPADITSLIVGDEEVSLEDGVYAYDLDQELVADANPEVVATTTAAVGAKVFTGFNRANNTAAVIVRGGDFAANPANVHTYLLSFADPQGPGTGFDAPVVPQVSLYTEGNMLYILSAETVQVEVYAVDGRLLTLTNEQVISLPSNGVYVVRVNGETHKVVAQ